MATNYVRFELRKDDSVSWELYNPILLPGEPGYDTTHNQLRIGDGSTGWTSLNPLAPLVPVPAGVNYGDYLFWNRSGWAVGGEDGTVVLGANAGGTGYDVAIGYQASGAGNSIAVGKNATANVSGSIVLDTSNGTAGVGHTGMGLFVIPLRDLAGGRTGFAPIYYNSTSGEIAYDSTQTY